MAKQNDGRKRKMEALGLSDSKLDRFLSSPTAYVKEECGIGKKSKGPRRKKPLPGEELPKETDKYGIIPDFCDDLFDTPSGADGGLGK